MGFPNKTTASALPSCWERHTGGCEVDVVVAMATAPSCFFSSPIASPFIPIVAVKPVAPGDDRRQLGNVGQKTLNTCVVKMSKVMFSY